MQKTDLSLYNNHPFHPGGNVLKRFLWYYVNVLFFKSGWFPVNGLKIVLLKIFGAKLGTAITIKPCVNVKYPWFLTIGNNTWIGENVFIDSLVPVIIGSNVCLSQGATLLTGSHNYKKKHFRFDNRFCCITGWSLDRRLCGYKSGYYRCFAFGTDKRFRCYQKPGNLFGLPG